jgi:hypothetical protein
MGIEHGTPPNTHEGSVKAQTLDCEVFDESFAGKSI